MSRLMAVATILAAMAWAGAANAADKLVLQLSGPAQFEFAGYYAALWQGFYRDAGLDVTIKTGAGQGETPGDDPVRAVTEGRAQFGVGTADLVVRAAQGLPLLLLAPIFQESGARVYYRADTDFPSPGALAKAKLGRMPASNILDIELATALKAEGIDPRKLQSVALAPDKIVAALADRSIDAAPGSAWDMPWLAYEKGITLKAFDPADYRVEFYGDTLFTLRRLARTEPQLVRRFRAASLKGWDYALQHQDDVAGQLVARLPHPPGIADAAGFDRYQAGLARRLARYPQIALGHSNPDRWERIEASLSGVGALLRTADADEFVFDPDAAARSRTDLRAFAILGATLAAGIAVLLFLWLRWRRQPRGRRPALAAEPAIAAPPGDVNALLAGIERAIRRRVPHRIAFRLSLLRELWRCDADPQTVRALVLDLVTAACADIKGGGELIVGTRNYAFDAAALAEAPGARIGSFVRVTVRDNGPGFAAAALDSLLDPAATQRPPVAAAAQAMRALGGFARVESAEGVGTAVHLYFPRAAEADAGAAPAASKEPVKAAE